VRIAGSAPRMALLLALSFPRSVGADTLTSPLSFFEGRTESIGVLNVALRSPKSSRSHGMGSIAADGSLRLVQRVDDEGKAPHLRHWNIREVSPGHFTGSMSEATGPLSIVEVGHRFRFRFSIKGGLAVEEWLTPNAGGRSAENEFTIRKFGIPVASFRGVVRKGV
jgi:hypothetical protein